jgi:hypothetical protein
VSGSIAAERSVARSRSRARPQDLEVLDGFGVTLDRWRVSREERSSGLVV